MLYHFRIYKEKTGYWAQCIELEGCHTRADTPDELMENMREALNLYLDEPSESNIAHPIPGDTRPGKNIAAIPVDPRTAFAVLLRHYRKKHNISQAGMAEKLNMKNVYSYQRLEKKTDPKLSTLAKIKEVFPDFPVENLFP